MTTEYVTEIAASDPPAAELQTLHAPMREPGPVEAAFRASQEADAALDAVAGECHPDADPEVVNDATARAWELRADADAAYDRWQEARAEVAEAELEAEAEL